VPIQLGDIARQLDCVLHQGDPHLDIEGVCGMEQAGPRQLTFLATKPMEGPIATLISKQPYVDFARALELFYQPPRPPAGIHATAWVAPSATVGEGASIGPFAVVGERVTIGRNAVIHPHVVLYEGVSIGDDFLAHSGAVVREFCRIGNRVILQNNVVVGGDGYGFAKQSNGAHYKIPQSGITVIEDDVEIQALTNIDRATVGETRIQRGAKVDSLVQIGHACVVGEDNIICSQTGLAGSSILGRNVLLAGQVGISGHLTIHDNAIVYAQSGIGGDVEAGAIMSGSPAFDAATWRRAVASFPKLPALIRSVRKLENELQHTPAEGEKPAE
jgi:UDP-3-O-[3-hydroxymyristoyl] glucosamine N-acyltransferase